MNASAHRSLFLTTAVMLAAASSWADAAPRAYVANQENGTLSIIDTAKDEVVRTLPASGRIGQKIQAVVTDPAEKTAFVVDAEGNAIVLVDLASGEVKQRVAVGKSPEGASHEDADAMD